MAKYRLVDEVRQAPRRPALATRKWRWSTCMYHDVDRSRGLFYKLQERDQVDRIVHRRGDRHRDDRPAADDGARLRGAFVRRAKERRRDFTVDWVHLKLNDQAQRTVLLKDPFRAHDERVERLIASL